MRVPIGELLVNKGILSALQSKEILERQQATHRPFGEIAEELFGIDGRDVERAWAEQYAKITKWVDAVLEPCDPMVRDLVSRRQAWQFRVLPLGYDGGDLMVCTTQESLVRAMNFAVRQIPTSCYFVLSTPENLASALMRTYPMDGMVPELIEGEAPAWPGSKRKVG